MVLALGTKLSVLRAERDNDLDLLEGKLSKIAMKKQEWAELPLSEKISLLGEVAAAFTVNKEDWARRICEAKGFEVHDDATRAQYAAELQGNTYTIMFYIGRLRATLMEMEKTGKPTQFSTRRGINGQTVCDVFPLTDGDKKLFKHVSGEIYLTPGADASQAAAYAQPEGHVCAVLGANNVSLLGLVDALDHLFVRNQVVFLKHSDVFLKTAPAIEQVLRPLIMRGYVEAAACDVPASSFLLHHPLVDSAHFTGGVRTFDHIVWGAPAEQELRKERDDPYLQKPITSELGNVTPWIVVPGVWSEDEIDHYAAHLANSLMNNLSCNCLAPKALVLSRGWVQAPKFVTALRKYLRSHPSEPPYYPGIRARQQAFIDAYPMQHELIKHNTQMTRGRFGEHLPVVLLPDVPLREGEHALVNEAFAPVLAITYVDDVTDAGDFLRKATAAANNVLQGSLTCTVICDPNTQAQYSNDLEQALADLKYGSVCLNVFGTIGFVLPTSIWGGCGGTGTLRDPVSGIGNVHNALMIDHPQKAVVRSKFADAGMQGRKSTAYAKNAEKSLAIAEMICRPGFPRLLNVILAIMPDRTKRIIKMIFGFFMTLLAWRAFFRRRR